MSTRGGAFIVMLVIANWCGIAYSDEAGTFRNPVIAKGADPWVIRHTDGWYYFCGSSHEEITLTRSKTLTGLAAGESKVIRPRRPPGPSSKQVWAPELHWIEGAWYSYFAASDGDNANHRMFVLENRSTNPFEGEFVEKGRISDPLHDVWAIDGTVLSHRGTNYFLWSGVEGERLDPQILYIARMATPWSLASERVEISRPTREWERRGDPDVNEGPQALAHDGRLFVVYSASGSWTDDYCLGLLSLKPDRNPLDASAWVKTPSAVFASANDVHGPGHCSFTKSPDGTEDWIVYHAAQAKGSGWKRSIRMQPFGWSAEGEPVLGKPVATGTALKLPAGERRP